ncbi:unnamed protein product [Mytilus edulis]|uniref:Uncharacterized protein n=1 Tax=Mytilus edulis TaxID=6550 RepID=A0A8S3S7B5_MYTED|nr:unnamed protein product [Mytilus edulis]
MMSPSHYCQIVRTEDKRCDHPIIDRLSELKTDDNVRTVDRRCDSPITDILSKLRQSLLPTNYCQTVRTEDRRCDHHIFARLSELKTDDVTIPLLTDCQNCRQTIESSDESSDESVDYFDVDYVLERTVDSEPTFTDEPAVDVTEPAQDAFIPLGDAQPEGNQGPEMETASGSASDIVGDVIPQEDTPVEQEEQPQELEMSPVPVRRSGRDRKPPAWISSGLYDISAIGTTSVGHTITEEHSKPTAEWQEKAEYITSLARTPLFSGLQREAALAILDIVNHH